jgi:spermidine synthase
MALSPAPLRSGLATALMLTSGFAGLGYQIIWTQQFALCLGNESAAVLAVVAAFFSGLGLGALALGSRVEASAVPQRWYAAAEALTATWGLVLAVCVAPIGSAVLGLTGATPTPLWQWGVAFGSTFLVLLPATAAMGVTLPALERAISMQARKGRSIAGLYAANTLGAVIGVLGIALWLIPRFGLLRAACVCVVFNALAGIMALRTGGPRIERPEPVPAIGTGALAAQATLAATGLLGIGFEMLVVRVLSQVAEDTVYTFALLLAVYLLGTSAGAYAHHRALSRYRDRDPAPIRSALLVGLGLACLSSTLVLYGSEAVKAWVLHGSDGGLAVALAAEAGLALVAFALPTLVMGALFSELCEAAQRAGVTFGRAIGVNTLGAAIAPGLFGVLMVPWLGLKLTLIAVCVGYGLLGAAASRRSPWPWLALAGCAAVAVLMPRLAFIEVPAGGRVVSYVDGVTASVSVVEDAGGVSRLRINNRQQEGANADRRVDGRQALLPLLLHPMPHRGLFLGVGAGNTSATAAEEAGVEVDAVELLPEVIGAATLFTRDYPADVRARLHFIAADARRYIRTTARRYDVIVADNFHPARGGTGALYTVEHFKAVRTRLAPGGLFCQWLPLHQLDLDSLRSVVRSFLIAYPHGFALLASNSLGTPTVGLVGRADDRGFDLAQVAARVAAYGDPQRRAEFGIEDEFAVLGGFIAGPAALARFAADTPANTDDHPVVAYGAPRLTYAPDSTPAERLTALLQDVSLSPAELVGADGDPGSTRRLGAYWAARDRFIGVGRAVRPSADPAAMLDQIEAPLLGVLRISPDFRPAYDPLLRLAQAVSTEDPQRGRTVLRELAALQPARTEAANALADLGVPR